MGVQRWTVALDGYLIPIGGGREREVYDDGEQVVLAADYDRDVAEAETRGWNKMGEAAINAVRALCNHDDGTKCGLDETLDAIAALRKPEVEG